MAKRVHVIKTMMKRMFMTRLPHLSSPRSRLFGRLAESHNAMPWLCGLAIAIGFSVVALATSVAVADMPGGDKKSDMLQSQAESATKPSSANPQEAIPVEELERQLRSSDFKLRQQAMMQLWSNRERYRPWVEQAVNDNDPEVVRRATWILDRWKRGLLPQLPAHVMEKLQSSSGPTRLSTC